MVTVSLLVNSLGGLPLPSTTRLLVLRRTQRGKETWDSLFPCLFSVVCWTPCFCSDGEPLPGAEERETTGLTSSLFSRGCQKLRPGWYKDNREHTVLTCLHPASEQMWDVILCKALRGGCLKYSVPMKKDSMQKLLSWGHNWPSQAVLWWSIVLPDFGQREIFDASVELCIW